MGIEMATDACLGQSKLRSYLPVGDPADERQVDLASSGVRTDRYSFEPSVSLVKRRTFRRGYRRILG